MAQCPWVTWKSNNQFKNRKQTIITMLVSFFMDFFNEKNSNSRRNPLIFSVRSIRLSRPSQSPEAESRNWIEERQQSPEQQKPQCFYFGITHNRPASGKQEMAAIFGRKDLEVFVCLCEFYVWYWKEGRIATGKTRGGPESRGFH